jgi:hypothetical protein
MSTALQHPAIAEFAARTNADTIREIQAAHREELRELHRKLAIERRKAADVRDSLLNAVVNVNGKWFALYSLFEDARLESPKLTRVICDRCRIPKCNGSDGAEGCQ